MRLVAETFRVNLINVFRAGWAAATGHIGPAAWALFAILFAWQHPHFFAIAWMFRNDYRAVGFKMLPVIEPSGQ
jgi:protoheme IX farnesyltransferase